MKYFQKFLHPSNIVVLLLACLIQSCATVPSSGYKESFTLVDGGRNEYNYKSEYTLMKHEEPVITDTIEPRKKDEKYVYIDKTSFDVKKGIKYCHYKTEESFREQTSDSNLEDEKEKKGQTYGALKIDNSIFTDELNMVLAKTNFIDTLHTIFPNIGNCTFINATVKKIVIHTISKIQRNYNKPIEYGTCAEMEIEWELLDFYKQKLYTFTTINKSDILWDISNKVSDVVERAIFNNLEHSFTSLRKELRDKGLLTITEQKNDTSAAITIDRPVPSPDRRMNDFMKSVVTIKVDDGHGSGVIVTPDGMIVTNYHVVVGSKKIEVLFGDGNKADAEVVKANANADLALIKVKRDGLVPLLLSEAKEPEIGIDVWAIGTPKSIELGESVSKGIISGVRNANNMIYLQVDVSVNPGNSGGPLINKDGTVLGIVSSKLIGIGTEGVGFAILSDNVFSALKLKYK